MLVAQSFQLFAVAHQALLSMGFSRQKYWSGLPLPSPGDLPDPGIKPSSLLSAAVAGSFLYHLHHLRSPGLYIFLNKCCKFKNSGTNVYTSSDSQTTSWFLCKTHNLRMNLELLVTVLPSQERYTALRK